MEGNTAENRASLRMRWVRLGEEPTVSVVVTSRGDKTRLEDCLRSLVPQCELGGAEVVVVRAAGEAELNALGEAWPVVRFVGAELDSAPALLRMAGMTEANGDIVVLQEDEAVPPDWLAQHARNARSNKGVSE